MTGQSVGRPTAEPSGKAGQGHGSRTAWIVVVLVVVALGLAVGVAGFLFAAYWWVLPSAGQGEMAGPVTVGSASATSDAFGYARTLPHGKQLAVVGFTYGSENVPAGDQQEYEKSVSKALLETYGERAQEAVGGDLARLEVETRFDPSGRSGKAVATLNSASDRQARVHLSVEMDESDRWRFSLDRFEEP